MKNKILADWDKFYSHQTVVKTSDPDLDIFVLVVNKSKSFKSGVILFKIKINKLNQF